MKMTQKRFIIIRDWETERKRAVLHAETEEQIITALTIVYSELDQLPQTQHWDEFILSLYAEGEITICPTA